MLNSLRDFILNLIYKKNCLICNCAKSDSFLCKTCAKNLQKLSNFPHKIYREVPIYSATLYSKTTKKLIKILKFEHRKTASKPLAKMLFEYFKTLKLNDDYIIAYPPNYFFRKSQRGYDHMELIAKEFSKLSGLEIDKNLIKKVKNTTAQYKAKNRKKNIKGAFKVRYTDKNILLIDDIITTGATVEEIIDCFLEIGVSSIVCVTVAKA